MAYNGACRTSSSFTLIQNLTEEPSVWLLMKSGMEDPIEITGCHITVPNVCALCTRPKYNFKQIFWHFCYNSLLTIFFLLYVYEAIYFKENSQFKKIMGSFMHIYTNAHIKLYYVTSAHLMCEIVVFDPNILLCWLSFML